MADSDVIGGIENLTDAVSGETPSYEYKDPNTDMMKAISKCIDAADGTIDDQYEYKNPNTDVIKKMDELADAIAEGGGGGSLPSVVYFSSVNGRNDTVMSYTFTESGIYQIYSLIKYGDAQLSPPTLELNDVNIPVQTYSNTAYIIIYAQIEVSSGDVLKCVPTATGENSGRQLVVLNGANFDPFTFIGYVPNDGTRFDITGSKFALEVYDMGYWQGCNNYQYHIIAGEAKSVPIPGGSGYFYGGIYAIKLQ